MASLNNALKQKLERLLEMQDGYVLDFNNNSFADFVQTSVGFDPYERYEGSKASILRQIWKNEPASVVCKLNQEMLDRWRTNKLATGNLLTAAEQTLFDELQSELKSLSAPDGDQYDIAVSFAGEHRDYVSRTVEACKKLGLRVFYDKDKNNEWWGGNFIRKQRTVYSSQTRFFVPFLSNEYVTKPIPMDEFSSAMMTAVKQGDGYILPVLMDNVDVPPDLLHPHIHYFRSEDYSPEELASELQEKVASAKASGQEPEDIGETIERALKVRMPKIVPADWSKVRERDQTFDYIAKRFKEGATQLETKRVLCTVRSGDEKISARIEHQGKIVAGIDIRRGGPIGEDGISWQVGTQGFSDNTSNGWATFKFDKANGTPYVSISDFGLMMVSEIAPPADAEGLFEHLWDRLLEQFERD